MARKTSARGRASFRVTADRETFDVAAPFSVDADGNEVSVTLGTTDPPLVTRKPDVVKHYDYLGVRAAREALREAHANRPVTPLPAKPPKAVPGKNGKVVCWRCGNRPDEVERCDACDATGLVRPGGGPLDG